MLFFWQGWFQLPTGGADWLDVIGRDVWIRLPRRQKLIILAMLAALDE
jgi:hypothetical protein